MQPLTMRIKSVSPLANLICFTVLFVGYLCFFSGRFYVSTFGRLGFDSVLYTLSAELGGVHSGQITNWLLKGFLPAIAFTGLTSRLLFCRNRKKGKYYHSVWPL